MKKQKSREASSSAELDGLRDELGLCVNGVVWWPMTIVSASLLLTVRSETGLCSAKEV